MLENLIRQLTAGQPLTVADVQSAVIWLTAADPSPELKADFLTALARKGETPEEIAAFAMALREKSLAVPLPAPWRESRELLDIVGTGGDRLGTFNISTTTAILCAAAGAMVAKHGNRAVTSQSGSADVLEALGIPINLDPAGAAAVLQAKGFCFLFAPNFHPAFQHIGPARKICATRGQRTLFNILGPLLNPVRPSAMMVGVSRTEWCEPFAKVLQTLGVRRGMVVCGSVGEARIDELSTLGDNQVAEFYHERGFTTSGLSLEPFPLQPVQINDLLGGDKYQNAEITRRILSGADQGPKRDAVLLNASAALFVAGRVKSLAEGWDLAGETIDSGRATAKLTELAS